MERARLQSLNELTSPKLKVMSFIMPHLLGKVQIRRSRGFL